MEPVTLWVLAHTATGFMHGIWMHGRRARLDTRDDDSMWIPVATRPADAFAALGWPHISTINLGFFDELRTTRA